MSTYNPNNSEVQNQAEAIAIEWDKHPAQAKLLDRVLRNPEGTALKPEVQDIYLAHYNDEQPLPFIVVMAAIRENESFAQSVLDLNTQVAKNIITEWAHDDGKSALLHELLHDADNKLTPEAAGVFYKYYNDLPPSNLTVALGLAQENPSFANAVIERDSQEQAKAEIGPKSWSATIAAQNAAAQEKGNSGLNL